MKTLIESAGKVASRVRVGGHVLMFDQPSAIAGGEDRGPSPLDVLLAALGACAHYYAAAFLQGRGLPVEGLSVEVVADKEPGPPHRLGAITMWVRVPDNLNNQQLLGIERAIKHCPAYATFVHPPAIEIAIDRVSGAAETKVSSIATIGWAAPERQLDADTARRAVLAQHEKIRGLLSRARSTADAALDGTPLSPDAVASVIGDLRSTMEVHLTFEERVLVPLLERDPPIGPQRAQRLREEHKQQRAVLSAIHHEACSHPELPTLAAKLAFLTSWLIDDMAEEEHSLLVPEVIRDDGISVDQNTG